jgi:dsRNA-specific ribonuclease
MAHSINTRFIPSEKQVAEWLSKIYGMTLNRAPSVQEKMLAKIAAEWGLHQKESYEEFLFSEGLLTSQKVVDAIKKVVIPTINAHDTKEEWITLLDEKDILEILNVAIDAMRE